VNDEFQEKTQMDTRLRQVRTTSIKAFAWLIRGFGEASGRTRTNTDKNKQMDLMDDVDGIDSNKQFKVKVEHPKIINTLARLCGAGFIIVGAILTICGINWHDRITFTISVIVVVLGVLLLKAKGLEGKQG
jgi:hypothetical protein